MKPRVLFGAVFALAAATAPAMAASGSSDGAVFTLTNQTAGNAVQVYERAAGGGLNATGTVPTGGLGTGAGLGSQGAIVLEDDRLFAVDAGSDEITAFAVDGTSLRRTAHLGSGGTRPISVTVHDDVLYVLNAGSATSPGNITGFRVGRRGRVTPIPGSTRPLSGADVGPAQLQFSPDGDTIVVTEKTTNLIDTYNVTRGIARGPVSYPATGSTPFGFDFDRRGNVIVSDAVGGGAGASGVSSYSLRHGTLAPVTGFLGAAQTAACWLVTTDNGRFAYVANTGSASVSSFAIGANGALTVRSAVAGTTGVTPIDVALSGGSRYLFALTSGSHAISAFRVKADGDLAPVPGIGGLPAGTVGLAAE